MSEITEQLREAAKCAPMWKSIFETAADEIERLQKREDNLVNVGSIGKIKADAVRTHGQKALSQCERVDGSRVRYHEALGAISEEADKLERGDE